MTAPLTRHELRHPDGRTFVVYGDLSGDLRGQPADTGFDVSHLHRRFDLLTGTWVLVSPARNARPGGDLATGGPDPRPVCPLCPGGDELPWRYDLAVFDNRFPSMAPAAPLVDGPLLAPSRGRCQVVVYTEHHDGSLATLAPERVARVVAVWTDATEALWRDGHAYVMAFENRGSAVGATLAHPHGQIYAFDHVPPTIGQKVAALHAHRHGHGRCVGCALVAADRGSDREIAANDSFVAAVPFAARWPYEVHVRALRHRVGRLGQLDAPAQRDLAMVLHDVVRRYDEIFGFALPYLMCFQEAPAGPGGEPLEDWHLHLELLPPHRSAHRLKVRASVETALGVFINDVGPERAAHDLRATDPPQLDWTDVRVPAVVRA